MSFVIDEFSPGKGFHAKISFDKEFTFPEENDYNFSFQLKADSETKDYSIPIKNAALVEQGR